MPLYAREKYAFQSMIPSLGNKASFERIAQTPFEACASILISHKIHPSASHLPCMHSIIHIQPDHGHIWVSEYPASFPLHVETCCLWLSASSAQLPDAVLDDFL